MYWEVHVFWKELGADWDIIELLKRWDGERITKGMIDSLKANLGFSIT